MSNVLTPTYYGPVGYSEISGTTALDSQTQGSLTQLIQQPSDQSPSFENKYYGTYTESWKGPYSLVRELPTSYFRVGTERSKALASLGQSRYVSRFRAPSAGTDMYGNVNSWVIKRVEVQEEKAGDHATIKVTYDSQYVSDQSGADNYEEDPTQDVWSMQWQSYNVSPYAFCKNDEIKDPLAKDYKPDPDPTAWRKNIETFLNSDHSEASTYEYKEAMGSQIYTLNLAERKVAKKIIDGTNAVYHYPILTHSTETTYSIPSTISSSTATRNWLSSVMYHTDVGGEIDHIIEAKNNQTTPAGCPYKFKVEWQWVKVGDQMQQTKTLDKVKFNRTETWWGVISADQNFYGNTPFDHKNLDTCRWEIGKV